MNRRLVTALALGAVSGVAVLVYGVAASPPQAAPIGTTAASRPHDTGTAPAAPGRDALASAIAAAQVRLRELPSSWSTWADLGSAYVQQARIALDPSYLVKADGALATSMRLHAKDNVGALVGLGSLANARHDFAAAARYGRRALAVNGFEAGAYAVLDDAYTQLGDYGRASDATQHLLELRPGVSAFTRASYEFEERGDVAQARYALERALTDATTPADQAFCRYYLGELAFNNGDLREAARQYAAGLTADPAYDPLYEGRAKVEAARGERVAAVRDFTAAISRVPQPQYVTELGDYLTSVGDAAGAARAYRLVATEQALFAANGVLDDLGPAQFDADHGRPAAALRHAQREWGRRHSVLVADALAWALHANGRDQEALHYAQLAGSLGWRNALFSFHRGMIELALRDRAAAARDLRTALAINPSFSALQAPVARRALQDMGVRP